MSNTYTSKKYSHPFNPLTKKGSELASDINKATIGGLGIHIVKKLMDDIWYERKQGKNKLTLKKFIHAANHLYKNEKASKISSNYFAYY
ncbi:MAG: ATP-binding protein [Desulfobacterales bacterium]